MKEKEKRLLLAEAKKAADEGRSLTEAFKTVATETKKAVGSVRNFYYSLLKSGASDRALKEKYPQLSALTVKKKKEFTLSEEEELLKAVDEGVARGKSVRRVIRELTAGDEKLALRYQNKYRNLTRERRACVFGRKSVYEKLCEEIDGLVEKLKAAYEKNGGELKKENEALRAEIKALKQKSGESSVVSYFGGARKNESEVK